MRPNDSLGGVLLEIIISRANRAKSGKEVNVDLEFGFWFIKDCFWRSNLRNPKAMPSSLWSASHILHNLLSDDMTDCFYY